MCSVHCFWLCCRLRGGDPMAHRCVAVPYSTVHSSGTLLTLLYSTALYLTVLHRIALDCTVLYCALTADLWLQGPPGRARPGQESGGVDGNGLLLRCISLSLNKGCADRYRTALVLCFSSFKYRSCWMQDSQVAAKGRDCEAVATFWGHAS